MRLSLRQRIHAVLALFLGLAAAWGGWQWYDCLPAGIKAEYVGRDRCIQCHAAQAEQWKGSHHDLAMDPANPKTVLGNFDNATFKDSAVTAKFSQKDGKYFVTTDGVGGKEQTFELPYTFGFAPLQQYLAKYDNGRYQSLPIAWDDEKKQWYNLYPNDRHYPDEWLHWSNGGMNWNYMCAECHSTNLQKNYDAKTNSYHTTWTDIDVSCESCHGPGSVHLSVVERNRFFGDRRYGTGLAKLKSSSNQVQVDACGTCHARKRIVHPGFAAGDNFLDYFAPELLDTEAYYPDGQIRDEDYEYTSFHLSLMYHKNIRCTDCHDPHTIKLKAKGNDLCIRCHQAGKYDAPSHHFHSPKSTGAQCVECHMPETTYMGIDKRRDHSFRTPRPDLTISMNLPNACNRCHQDKTAEWSQEHMRKWYPKKPREKRLDFAAAIAGGREGKPDSEKELQSLARDAYMPAFLRASALALLRNYPPAPNRSLDEKLLQDPHPLVRTTAVRNLGEILGPPGLGQPEQERRRQLDRSLIALIAGMLNDSCQQVRIEAAAVLSSVPRDLIPADRLASFDAAQQAYIEGLEYLADDAGANNNLGNVYAGRDEFGKAEMYYQRALDRDPNFHAARLHLAWLHYTSDNRERALTEFVESTRRLQIEIDRAKERERNGQTDQPRFIRYFQQRLAEAHHYAGLLLAEDPKQLDAAIGHLKAAVTLDPTRHRTQYNLGIAYQSQQKLAEAEQALRAAHEADKENPDYLYALAVFYFQRNDRDTAKKILRVLLSIDPRRQDARQLLQQIQP